MQQILGSRGQLLQGSWQTVMRSTCCAKHCFITHVLNPNWGEKSQN